MKQFRHTFVINVFTSAENAEDAQKQSDLITATFKIGKEEIPHDWIDCDMTEVLE